MSLTKTASHEYCGVKSEIEITKTAEGFYSAVASICYHCGATVTIDFLRGEHRLPWLSRDGQLATENPYKFIIGYIEGFLDYYLEDLKIYEAKGSDVNLMIIKYGKERVMKAIRAMKTLEKHRKKPHFKATPEHEKQCREAIESLIDRFGSSVLSAMTNGNYSRVNFNMWKQRGRISAVAAHEITQIETIKASGFTREILRPDIADWSEIENT